MDARADEWSDFRDHYPRCPDCSREVARVGTLLAALRIERPEASAHPTERQLVMLATSREQLGLEEREGIASHLAGCAPCRTELAVLQRFDWQALAATPKRPSWLERLGLSLVSALPRPLLAAALAVVVALPAYFVWRLSSRGSEVPRVARIEEPVKAPPAPPAPIEVAKPIEPEPLPPDPKPEVPAAPQEPVPPPAAKPSEPVHDPAPAQKPLPEPEPRTIEIAALIPSEAPLYAPGALAGSGNVRIGGTSRSVGPDVPVPQVLAPEHVGQTSRESPTLYWFLPAPTPLSAELTIVDPNAEDPLLEVALPGPLAAGIHSVRLAQRGVRLAPGVEYQWFVALVVDPERRARDVVSGGSIRYAPASTVATSPPARLAHAYAEAGLWYDAFDQLSSWLATEPDAAVLHQHRAALLEQVGLGEAASYERR